MSSVYFPPFPNGSSSSSFFGKDYITPSVEAVDLVSSSPSISPVTSSPIDHFPSTSSSSPLSSQSSSSPHSDDSENDLLSNIAQLVLPISHHPMLTRSKTGVVKPNPKYFVGSISGSIEPKTVQEALQSAQWKQAMQLEFDALMSNNTWQLVPWHSSYNIVGAKWVFKLKHNADGSIQQYKARLVAKGFHQNPGIDFNETFSLVVKPQTIRVVLSLAISQGWSIKQLDVNNAFLNSELKETIYMTQPEGFVNSQYPTHVCKLVKALYGLKQAPRAWFEKLKFIVLKWGFIESKADASLFIYSCHNQFLALLVYVDDIILTGSDLSLIDKLIKDLHTSFALKDLGDLHYFLGIEVFRDATGLYLTQSKCITDLLAKNHMINCKPCSTPASTNVHLSCSIGEPLKDVTAYRSAIGGLQYLTMTRPDIAYIVNKLSQFLHCPTSIH